MQGLIVAHIHDIYTRYIYTIYKYIHDIYIYMIYMYLMTAEIKISHLLLYSLATDQ